MNQFRKYIISISSLILSFFLTNCTNDNDPVEPPGTPPISPVLISPVNAATNIEIPTSFEWNSSTGAANYYLQVAKDSLFSNKVVDQNSITDTKQQISLLRHYSKYWWRVKAVNINGSSDWSATNEFTTISGPCTDLPTINYEGKLYNTVEIADQCWLRENLDVGTRINGSNDQTNNGTIEKYCYNDDPANCTTYGGLYRWNEAMQYSRTSSSKGICPEDWHLPTKNEVGELIINIGGAENGNSLKAIGQGVGDGIGSNESGFSALLAGSHGYNEYFGMSDYTFFWVSNEFDFYSAYDFSLDKSQWLVNSFLQSTKTNGFSIRCIKD